MSARTLLLTVLAVFSVSFVAGVLVYVRRGESTEPNPFRDPIGDKALFETTSPFLRGVMFFGLVFLGLIIPLGVNEWTTERLYSVALVEAVIAPWLVVLAAPRRFRLLGRVIAAVLCAGCFYYLGYELAVDPNPAGGGSVSEPNVFNAARAFLFLGLPSGWYAIKGRLV